MVIFVYGDDRSRVLDKVRVLTEQFSLRIDARGYNKDVFTASEVALGRVREVALATPFFAEKRLVVVRGIEAWKEEAGLADFLAALPSSTIFLAYTVTPAAEVRAWGLQTGVAEYFSYEFETLSGRDLARYFAEEAARRGMRFSSAAVERSLLERCGTDTGVIANVLEALAAYSAGAPLTLADLQWFTEPREEDTVFPLLDAYFGGQRAGLALLLQDLSPEAYFGLLPHFWRQSRLVLGCLAARAQGQAAVAAFGRALGVHSFVLQKIQALPDKAFGRAQALVSALATLEHQAKQGEGQLHLSLPLLFLKAA